jgi:hypothetical protein
MAVEATLFIPMWRWRSNPSKFLLRAADGPIEDAGRGEV